MKNIFTAIGIDELNQLISKQPNVNMIDIDIQKQELLFEKLNEKNYQEADALIIIDYLPGPFSKYEMIQEIRNKFTGEMYVVLRDDEDEQFISYLRELNITNIFSGAGDPYELIDSVIYEENNQENSNSSSEIETQEVKIKEKIFGTIVIAIVGTQKRVGTTHTAIAVAAYLKKYKHKVALIELHKSDHFKEIKHSYENIYEKENYFTLNKLDYYAYSKNIMTQYIEVLEKDYNYVILDLGDYENCNKQELKRANHKIIVTGCKDWELKYLQETLEDIQNKKKYKYYITLSDQESFKSLKKNLNNLECYQAPYTPSLRQYKELDNILEKMLKEVLQNKKIKKKRLFKK